MDVIALRKMPVPGIGHESTGKVSVTKCRQELAFMRSSQKTTKKLVHWIVQPRLYSNRKFYLETETC
jgi:hypothetical protein